MAAPQKSASPRLTPLPVFAVCVNLTVSNGNDALLNWMRKSGLGQHGV